MLTYLKHMALAAAAALCAAPAAQAADQPQEWELINPTGEIEKVAVEPAKRITALEGKTSGDTCEFRGRVLRISEIY